MLRFESAVPKIEVFTFINVSRELQTMMIKVSCIYVSVKNLITLLVMTLVHQVDLKRGMDCKCRTPHLWWWCWRSRTQPAGSQLARPESDWSSGSRTLDQLGHLRPQQARRCCFLQWNSWTLVCSRPHWLDLQVSRKKHCRIFIFLQGPHLRHEISRCTTYQNLALKNNFKIVGQFASQHAYQSPTCLCSRTCNLFCDLHVLNLFSWI